MPACTLCPRQCAVDRPLLQGAEGHVGACGVARLPVVARAALHRGEEPCISGTRGSGAVFFSGCSLSCVFCQNREISAQRHGKEISASRLRAIFDGLIAAGAHNINLVNPTHFVPAIEQALEHPLSVPVVYNTGGYDRVEALRRLEGKVDVYLPDLKYRSAELAARYSHAADYPEVAAAAIREMVRQTGPCQFDENGLLIRGTLIRHLMLPGCLSDTRRVIDWVADTFPPHTVWFSLMSQYTPCRLAPGYPELNRRLVSRECTRAAEYLLERGITAGYTQSRDSACEDEIPAFDLTGVL